MSDLLRNAHIGLVLSTALGAVAGCHGATVCDPPGSTSGVYVRTQNSDAYVAQMNQAEADVPHVACRAETTVETQVWFMRNAELTPYQDPENPRAPKTRADSTPYDPRVMTPRQNVGKYAGQYRILGVGRGVDNDDCGKAAMRACKDGVDAYWRKQNASTPLAVECRLLDDRDRCPGAAGKITPVAAASGVPARNEPPLAALVKKLDDARTRPDAVKGIAQFFDNAKKRAGGNVNDASVKALLDQVIEPMTKAYTDGDLDQKTRGELIRFLAEARDERAGRAWIKALGSEDDLPWAALGIGATKYQEGAPALGEAFAKLEVSSPKGSQAHESVHAAMIALKNPLWKSLLLERVARPMDKPASGDAAKSAAYQNELFWQTTSADVLGELRDASATKSLVKVLMDRSKADVASSAALAIAGIGKDAVPVLIDILGAKDAELVDLAKSKAAENGGNAKTYAAAAATALGEVGRGEARDPLLKALKSADNDGNRAAVARQIPRLPATPEAEKAFQAAYEKLAPGANVALTSLAARPALLDAAAGFGDAAIVPWLLKQIKAAQGADAEDVRAAGLRSAIKLMKGAHVTAVRPVVEKLGNDAAKEAFRVASQLVETCDVAVDCYVAKLAESPVGFSGVKAAYMLAASGDAKAAAGIVERLAEVKNAEARVAALAAVDHLAGDDGRALADSLEKLEMDGTGAAESAAVRQVIVRLRAR